MSTLIQIPSVRVVSAAPSVLSQATIVSGARQLAGISDDGRKALVEMEGIANPWRVVDTVDQSVVAIPFDSAFNSDDRVILLGNGQSIVVNTSAPLVASDTDGLLDAYLVPVVGGPATLLTPTHPVGQERWVRAASSDGNVLAVAVGSLTAFSNEIIVVDRAAGTEVAMSSRFPGRSFSDAFLSGNGATVVLNTFTNGAPNFDSANVFHRPTNTSFTATADEGLGVTDVSTDGRWAVGRGRRIDVVAQSVVPMMSPAVQATYSVDGSGARIALIELAISSDRRVRVIEDGRTGVTAVTGAIGTDLGDVVHLSSDGNVLVHSVRTGGITRDVTVTRLAPRVPAFVPLTPARLLETRSGGPGTVDGLFNDIGRRGAGSVTELTVAGRGGVPTDAAAAVLNVTVTGPSGAGFITVFACGSARPNASNLNYVVDQTVANNVIASIGSGGKVCLFTLAETDLVVDVSGAIPADSGFRPLAPARLVETRPGEAPTIDGRSTGGGPIAAGGTLEVPTYRRGGLGLNVGSLVLNVTAIDPLTAGFVTIYRCTDGRPNASSLNFGARQTVANTVVIAVPLLRSAFPSVSDPTNTNLCVFASATTHLAIDLNGSFDVPNQFFQPGFGPSPSEPSDAPLTPLAPARLLETRVGEAPTIDGRFNGVGERAAGSITPLTVIGRGGVPMDADAVVLNVTVTGPARAGFITVFPCGADRPNASNLNFTAGATVANNVVARVGTDGQVCVFTLAPTHLVVDVTGEIRD